MWLYLITCQMGIAPLTGSKNVLRPMWNHMPLAVFMSDWIWMIGVVSSWMAQLPS